MNDWLSPLLGIGMDTRKTAGGPVSMDYSVSLTRSAPEE